MKLMRWISAIVLLVILVIAAWLWWHRPISSDMADYAPADALVYLECNSLLDVVEAIAGTDAWKELRPLSGTSGSEPPNRWLTRVISWTGIGPTRAVVLARAQLAAVMLDLGAKEQGETLTIKPEAAILIETHTAERRIRPMVEEALRLFAEKSYSQPALRRTQVDGSELLVWSAPNSERQIVATIDGTLVIIGNSERAVKMCLEVRRGQRPSLKSQPEMQETRGQLTASDTLAFGFISSPNAARLFSIGAPLLFARTPGGARWDRVIGSGASKILTGIGWSARAASGGIEDKYLFSLQSTLVTRLQPQFRPTTPPIQVLDMLPDEVHSVSVYRFENPVATWQTLETGLSAHLDTLSAMLVSALLKSALTPYGVEDSERFLRLVGPELSTVRLTRETEQSTLIAQVRDEASLRRLLLGPDERKLKHHSVGEAELIEIPGKATAVSFLKGTVLMGPPADLQLHLQAATVSRPTPDRSGIEVGDDVSISDYVNIYSHTHDIDNIEQVYNRTTRIGNGVRITYHATVLAGTNIGKHAMIGTGAVVTRDVGPYHIALGVPAKTIKVKMERPEGETLIPD